MDGEANLDGEALTALPLEDVKSTRTVTRLCESSRFFRVAAREREAFLRVAAAGAAQRNSAAIQLGDAGNSGDDLETVESIRRQVESQMGKKAAGVGTNLPALLARATLLPTTSFQ
jgi:hypothetical protein